jgi:hypothetical protein
MLKKTIPAADQRYKDELNFIVFNPRSSAFICGPFCFGLFPQPARQPFYFAYFASVRART